MPYFDRTDVSGGIDFNKTSKSKECDICHYWIFLNKGFNFQSYVCNEFHDLLVMSMNISDIAILNIKVSDYCCIISGISKSNAINLMQNVDLIEMPNIIKHKKILSRIKMGKEILKFGDIKIEKNKFIPIKVLFF